MHFLVILSLKIYGLVSSIEEQLCIVFMYTGNISIISTISQFESDSYKNTTAEETRTTPITDHEKMVKDRKKNACVASEKGS
jgi:hypothetical protein